MIGVAADADAGGLAQALLGELVGHLVGQGPGAGDEADGPGGENVAGHDADLALLGGDQAGAVGPDEDHAPGVEIGFDLDHVEDGDALGDAGRSASGRPRPPR